MEEDHTFGIRLPSAPLGILPAGSDARKTAQLRRALTRHAGLALAQNDRFRILRVDDDIIERAMKTLSSFMLLFATAANAQWAKVPVPTTASLRGLSVVSEKVVWASGTGGTVIRTVDGGKDWSVMAVPGAETLDFRGIRAFDDKTAVIISSGPAEKGQAHIYRTSNGGKTWQQAFEEKRAGIFFDAVAFWDRKHGIVLSDPVDGKFVLFTTDD